MHVAFKMLHPVKKGTHQKGRCRVEGSSAQLLKIGKRLGFSSFSPLEVPGVADFLTMELECPCLDPGWLPGCRETTQRWWMVPRSPPAKIQEKLTGAHDQEKVICLRAWREQDECTCSATAEKARPGIRSAYPREVPRRVQWAFDLRLNRAPV